MTVELCIWPRSDINFSASVCVLTIYILVTFLGTLIRLIWIEVKWWKGPLESLTYLEMNQSKTFFGPASNLCICEVASFDIALKTIHDIEFYRATEQTVIQIL